MTSGKTTVPGFHAVNGDYVRANPDIAEANNPPRTSKANLASEQVLPSARRS